MTVLQHLSEARARAIAVGGCGLDPAEERVAHPVDLLATAIAGLADLTAAVLIGLDLPDRSLSAAARQRARRQACSESCRALRLCQRALEADARNTGYDWRPWVDAAIQDTALHLEHPCDPPCAGLRHAEGLAHALGEAVRALTYDRMALPEALGLAQTHALILVVATEVRRPAARPFARGR